MKILLIIWDAILYALFPSRCVFCNKIIGLKGSCCPDCEATIPYVRQDICHKCSKDDCICVKEKFKFYRVAVPFYYGKKVMESVQRFKFSNCMYYGKTFAYYMAKSLLECEEAVGADYITYMPATRKSLRKRGYNQAKVLAEQLSKLTGIECKQLAIKIRETKQQHDLNGKERRKNVKGALKVNAEINIKDKKIIVCDDVLTTGASLNELSAVLKRAGAGEIIACVVCTTYCRN